MASEWRAGSGSDDEEEDGLAQATVTKRVTKAERRRREDEGEYTDGEGAEGARSKAVVRAGAGNRPSARGRPAGATDEGDSVYERVMNFVATQESLLGSTRPASSAAASAAEVGSSMPGQGLTADLASQPWCISTATLHAHQLLALNWLKARFELGLSAILADEMGLGKTLTAISFMAYLYELAHKQTPPQQNGRSPKKGAATTTAAATAASSSSECDGRVGPFLILCPLTLVSNWSSELESFAPCLSVLSYTGSRPEREGLQDDIRAFIRGQPKASRRDPRLPFHVLLTTYETVIADAPFLSRFQWRMLVVDEAHRLKNADSVLAQTLSSFSVAWKLLLTGTPVQNDLGEMWALLWQLHPALFDDKKKFVDEFAALAPPGAGQVANNSGSSNSSSENGEERVAAHTLAMERLHALLRPFMLRRLLSECALDIPPKRELILRTGLTTLQKGIYKNLLLKNYELIGGKPNANARALVNIVQSLRKVCNHAYHFPGVEPEPFAEGPHIYESSGKFTVLVRLLAVCRRMKRRVLLFSTSVQSLDLVQDVLSWIGYSYERLDGSVRGEERYEAIKAFQKTSAAGGATDQETFVFLLSTRAGGVGLNLCCADTVVFLDSDWNPQCDLQAQARAHRIGQTKPVIVVRLLAANTLEEIILRRTQRKLAMTHSILERGRFKGSAAVADDGETVAAAPTAKGIAGAAGGAEDNDAIGRSSHDLQNILQYGLDHLFAADGKASSADGSSKGGASSASVQQKAEEQEMTEEEIETILTTSLEEMVLQWKPQPATQEQKLLPSRAIRASASRSVSPSAGRAVVPAVSTAAAASLIAPRSGRPSLTRVATHALPSLEDASLVDGASSSSSAAPSQQQAHAADSVYVFEGTDFLAARKEKEKATASSALGLDTVEEELEQGAARGHAALAALVARARATGELVDHAAAAAAAGGADFSEFSAAPGSDRKRKAAVQETDDEREERLARNRELARQRAESARKKREQAEQDKQAQLQQLWQDNNYASASVALDDEFERRFATAGSATVLSAAVDDAGGGASEWGAGGGEENDGADGAAMASSSARPKAMLHYVVGDVTHPFVFEREDGQSGTTSQPATTAEPAAEVARDADGGAGAGVSAAAADQALSFLSSFDEAAESAAAETSAAEADAHMRSAGEQSCSPSSALLLIPVDASGHWGRGGWFRALDNRSSLIGAQYELIGQMQDLHMGDVHVIDVPADQLRPPPPSDDQDQSSAAPPSPLHVALCVVLKRAKGQQYGAPSLQPEHLSVALRKLSGYAHRSCLSVHLPRLGKDDPNIGWYGIERLLRKHVVGRGVSTFVYYFARRRPQYRSPVKNQLSRTHTAGGGGGSAVQRATSFLQRNDSTAQAAAAASTAVPFAAAAPTPMDLTDEAASSGNDVPATAAGATAAAAAEDGLAQPSLGHQLSDLSQFVDIFTGCVIYLHRGGGSAAAESSPAASSASSSSSSLLMSDSDARLVTRFLSAYDGEVSDVLSPRVTHIVSCEAYLTPELLRLKAQASSRVRVVQLAWVEQCVMQGRLDDSIKLQVPMNA